MPLLAFFFASLASLASPAPAFAQGTLPYAVRTKPFSAWSTTTHGDIRTVAMAGATVGLADTFIAAINNPAGLAMTLDTADSNYTENFVYDDRIQDYNSSMATTSIGAAAALYPWAFAVGYISPYREADVYTLPSLAGQTGTLDLITRELHFSAARVFAKNRVSLGASLALCQSRSAVDTPNAASQGTRYFDYSAGLTLGAMFRLPRRFLLGTSYTFPIRYNFSPVDDATPALPGFSQPVLVPEHYAAGLGWIPNRFLRADITLDFVGTTPAAALVRDESIEVGNHTTIEPRIGIAYIFADYKDFRATAFVGTYLEQSRIEGAGARFHKTAGIEMKPWIFTIGWGIDSAPRYSNYLVSFGLDVFKIMGKADLIPQPWQPPFGGIGPTPLRNNDEGLARPLVDDWKPKGPEIDPIKAGLDIPTRLEEKVIETGKTIQKASRAVFDSFKPFHKPRKNERRPKKATNKKN